MDDQTTNDRAIMPVMTMQAVIERRNAIVEFTRKAMKVNVDFGIIPGTGTKPTLLKPGAEKLCTLFGLSARFAVTDKVEDWTGSQHDGEPMFYYAYKCGLWHGNWLVAEGEGSCNSHEKKYRYRSGERICPKCGKAAIIKGKAEYGGGWLCFGKKGGCGEKFVDGDATIEGQSVGQVLNPDIADQVNTIQKMAQKRALIAATLLAVNASEFFTQDMDDMMIEGEYHKDAGPELKDDYSAAQNGGNGKAEHPAPVPDENAKPATLKYQPFVTWANEWVQGNGKAYARENDPNLANMYHLLKRIGMLKFSEVTAENAVDIKAALETFVKRGEPDKAQA